MYQFKFAAICRTDRKNHIYRLSAIADCEHDARRLLAARYVLFFQARIPVTVYAA
ncbi:host cell division inhibitor Icd-like protein [Pectobacterium aroidearum]|uniref:Host cell division inhibitor Icd-like protein n=1 Tax=Pectobacterium aroidearum TaxID=1201031 RepID=A0ABR5ZJG6_9GAMM|nr:host cell division inhibitor Icd-like protein [Pectobacterium aroidearum]MBA5234732.1 host cell division inhibitor Icd-like protein [Pectobacterium aroidearum]MBA5739910.1 host cell division inhibitor Icd-like protein [Pectobacterium aroidearum]